MSEVDQRPAPNRGRSSYRGGRGATTRGGPRGGGSRKPTNGTTADTFPVEESLEDQGELGEMKKKYASELGMLKDMFPDWTDVDLVFALQEADGDIPSTVDKITQGSVSQFAEVKSAKDRARSKVKEAPAAAGTTDKTAARGGRGRGGLDSTRGTRGRASDRGRGGFRGARGGHATTNGTTRDATTASVPTTESSAWDDSTTATPAASGWDDSTDDTSKAAGDAAQNTWGSAVTSNIAAASEAVKSALIPEGGPKKSWASMFAPKPAPPPSKKPEQQPAQAESAASGDVEPPSLEREATTEQPTSIPSIEEPAAEHTDTVHTSTHEDTVSATDGEEDALPPPKLALTEENVDHLPDDSHPPATATAVSTAGSMDPRNLTPFPGQQQAPIGRPPIGGYATSAYRATGVPGRSASYQRRVQEQQEAVVMPGHNAVDRAAVQFGSMGLNGEPGSDVDEDREEPETRQAPQHSPPSSQPRASLPPAPRQTAAAQDTAPQENLPTPKQAPGLPPASQLNQQQLNQQQMQDAAIPTSLQSEPPQVSQNYNQYGRYGQQMMQQDSGAQQQQKPYDPFSHQVQQQPQPSHYDPYGAHSGQQAQQHLPQSQPGFGGLSSAPNDMSQYYTSDQQRSAYSNYYGGSYGPQDARNAGAQSQQDAGQSQQRSTSGFGVSSNESAFPSQAQQQVSIPPSLLELNDALNHATNEEERHFLLQEIQRVVSTAQAQPSGVHASYGMPSAPRGGAGGKKAQGSPLYGNVQAQAPSFSDVTNISSASPSALHQLKSNMSNQASQQAQSRYVEAPGSGNNTPNPLMGGQQHGGPHPQQSQQASHQSQGGQPQHPAYSAQGYPYGHPYYVSPYQQAYQNQYGGYGQQQGGGYGGGNNGGYPAKQGGMYGQSHGYGMAPQPSYEQHSASPANTSAFGQNQQQGSMRSASGMSSGLGDLDGYGRQPAQSHQQSSAFGGMNDAFTRSTSGFGGQSGYGQQSMAGPEDSLKPYSDSKGGPSPALGQPGARPGSAANSAVGSGQSGLPPPQSHQSGFGGYPGFPSQSQYGSLGGLGGQQQQQQQQQQPGQQNNMGGQQGGYGSYGAGASSFGQTYGGYSRGGWGANYGAH
ncbi:RNAPII degradation factor [Extremus antarcticus]|uniref:RNA polymerase II degradation factor 1 n=1 Tax=Extremus antarcticus TaxID=702011 RepID=A0AAJ0DFD4_9PEZI|nr:RNAPII degradation factor [Extremus antarcticus]